jgi:hypothetical protein
MLGWFPINFLVLSIVHQGIAFPIFWTFLPKKGNSNTKERIELLNRFIAHFGTLKMGITVKRDISYHQSLIAVAR